MGCGSSKETPGITKAMRIEIAPQEQTTIESALFTKSAQFSFVRSSSAINTTVETVCKSAVSVRPPSNPARSPSSSSPALGLRRKKLSPDSKRARRSTASIISVEPLVSADVTQRQVSVSSHVTADSGFGEDNRTGISAGSRRNGEDEIMDFITEHSRTDTVRPVTPDLFLEGTSFLLPTHKTVFIPKQWHLPGSVDAVAKTANILEKAPLPPIHSQSNRVKIKTNLDFEEKPAQRMQVEQNFDVIERPPSRGGLTFDILLDVPTEKRALRPIEFSSLELPDKKGEKKRRSSVNLTKEAIDAKLAAAEERRNKRENDIINNLVEQREIDEKKMKEQQERYQESIQNKEVTIGTRMRTVSNNRDAAISARVKQAHKTQQKVENARASRKSYSLSPGADTSENTS